MLPDVLLMLGAWFTGSRVGFTVCCQLGVSSSSCCGVSTELVTFCPAQLKVKAEEASKSEAKFLKMKAWSKSRIRQLEDDLRKAQVSENKMIFHL